MAEPKKIELVSKVHTVFKAVEGFILIDVDKNGDVTCSLSKEFGYPEGCPVEITIKPVKQDKSDAKKDR